MRQEQEPVIPRTYDKPQAVLIPYEEFEAYQAWQDRRQKRGAWLAELRAIAEQVSARAALTDDEATELMNEAVRETADRPQPAAS